MIGKTQIARMAPPIMPDRSASAKAFGAGAPSPHKTSETAAERAAFDARSREALERLREAQKLAPSQSAANQSSVKMADVSTMSDVQVASTLKSTQALVKGLGGLSISIQGTNGAASTTSLGVYSDWLQARLSRADGGSKGVDVSA